MCPLIGSIGGSSTYAYRGNLDDYADDFSFDNVFNAEPGQTYNSNIVTITGINNQIKVSVSAGASFSVNSSAFSTASTFVRNGDTLQASYTTIKNNTPSDFSNEQDIIIQVGNRSPVWSITTKQQDTTPDPIVFINLTNIPFGIGQTSNQVALSGLEPGYTTPILVSGIGSVSINGGTPVVSGNVQNGDTLYLQHPILSANIRGDYDYSRTSIVSIGSSFFFWTTTSVAADLTPDAFSFTNVINANLNADVTSNSITVTGVNTITTPKFDIPISVTTTNTSYDINGSGVFTSDPGTVVGGDNVRVRVRTGSAINTVYSGTIDIGGVTGTFNVTTLASNTIPNAFSFSNISGASLGSSRDSNTITLSGITPGFFGAASITSGSFRVVRGGVTVRDFSSSSFQVTEGDQITLRLTSSSNYSSTVSTTFTVSGTDPNGNPGSRSASWSITTQGAPAPPPPPPPFLFTSTIPSFSFSTPINTSVSRVITVTCTSGSGFYIVQETSRPSAWTVAVDGVSSDTGTASISRFISAGQSFSHTLTVIPRTRTSGFGQFLAYGGSNSYAINWSGTGT
jgi:hypothetical protein